MTTQAQIEAAASAMFRYDVAWGFNSAASAEDYFEIAKVALTAAAEVGEQDLLAICLERIEATGKALEANTIERCAQVARERAEMWQATSGDDCRLALQEECEAIAAEISALKDKP